MILKTDALFTVDMNLKRTHVCCGCDIDNAKHSGDFVTYINAMCSMITYICEPLLKKNIYLHNDNFNK